MEAKNIAVEAKNIAVEAKNIAVEAKNIAVEAKNIVSFGAGQNSTAMIIEMFKRNIEIDMVLFADTGNEMPETYEWLPMFIKWCADRNIPFDTIRSSEYPLMTYYQDRNIIPFRAFRSCTDRFKVRPINRYVKSEYPNNFINMYMGISAEESQRAKETRRKNQKMLYPLIEWGINRDDCIEIIKNACLPVPVKSGCFFCPFQSKRAWADLLENHPWEYDKSMVFEENGKGFPEFSLMPIHLRKFKKGIKTQTKLKDFKVEQCVYCHL